MSSSMEQELTKARQLAAKAEGKTEPERGPLAAHEKGIRLYSGSIMAQAYGLDVGEEMAIPLSGRDQRVSAATNFAPGVRHPFLKEFTFETSLWTAVNTQTEAIRYVMFVKRVK